MLPSHRKGKAPSIDESQGQQWKQQEIYYLRLLTPFSLLCAAIIFGVGAYYLVCMWCPAKLMMLPPYIRDKQTYQHYLFCNVIQVDNLETRLADSQFDAIHESLGLTITSKFRSHLDILSSMKATVGHECPHATDWPNCSVSILSFTNMFDPLMNIGDQRSLGYGPIVTPDQVRLA